MNNIVKLNVANNMQGLVNGNLALKRNVAVPSIPFNPNNIIPFPMNMGVINPQMNVTTFEETPTYEKPAIQKIIKFKPVRRIFMGCWQSANEENGGDGC